MPTLIAQLPAGLNQLISLVPESTPTTANDVKGSASYNKPAATTGAPKPKQPTALTPLPTAALRPIDLLQTLGLAMLPPRHVQQHIASWHWTLVRYGYLIARSLPGAPLETATFVGDYRFHHMTALSEAFGVGCALSYAREWLQTLLAGTDATIYNPIDFDYLLGVGALPLPGPAVGLKPKKAPNATRQPDYLIVAEDGGQLRLLIVECKGTSGTRAKAIDQLGSAMHQLEGIIFAGSAQGQVAIDRHAYAARISPGGDVVKLYGVDPLEEGNHWLRPTIRAREDPRPLATRYEEGRLLLPSPEEVGGQFLRRLQDRTVAWAGGGDYAEDLDVQHAERQESEFGDVIGVTSSFRLPTGQAVEVFSGALVDVLQAAQDPDPVQALERTRTVRRRLEVITPGGADVDATRLRSDEDQQRVASVLSDDGLALRVEIK